MNKDLILEKQAQAAQILKEKNIDMWMTFVRESGNIKDPMLDTVVGTGATWHSAFIITKEGDTIAVIGSLEEGNMKQVGTFKTVKTYLKSVNELLIETLDEYKPEKIAINYSRNMSLADGLTHGVYLELTDILKNTDYPDRFVSSEDIVASLRGRKSETELDNMKAAIKETLKIFDEVGGFLAPGKTEKEVAAFVQNLVETRGFEMSWDAAYCPSVFTGPDTAGAHAGPTDRKIERGHVINMDFGVKVNGYCADLQRTWYVLRDGETEAPEAVKEGMKVIVDAITKAAEAMKPGMKGWEIDDVARSYITGKGYEEYKHGLGHQLGLAAHDAGCMMGPKWERYGNIVYLEIEKGQVFTIEPRLNIEGHGIATIEEEVVVGDNGVEFISDRQTEVYLVK